MNKNEGKKMFKKYNPEKAVVRCPRGRSGVKKQLDLYAQAAVNLYGVILIEEFVEIYNSQNEQQTTVDEVFILLLPLVLKKEKYWFYGNYLAHYLIIDHFDWVDKILADQKNKPRFIPNKELMLEFCDEMYDDSVQGPPWRRLFGFIIAEWRDNPNYFDFYYELRYAAKLGFDNSILKNFLNEYKIVIKNEQQLKDFFDLFMIANNNSRIWANKGHTPHELFEHIKYEKNTAQFPEKNIFQDVKISPNAPCPCGSGKKYKKCCRVIERSEISHLSKDDQKLFYQTWIELLSFIKFQERVIYKNKIPNNELFELRELLWENPDLIDDFLIKNTVSESQVQILKGWRKHFKKQTFILVDYTPEHALVIASDDNGEDAVYGVKGITDSIALMLKSRKPIYIDIVLLPFKDCIIYDSYLQENRIFFKEGAVKMTNEIYQNALKKGIVTKFE